jgi:hypothetical protein
MGDLALVNQIIAVLDDSDRLVLGLLETTARGAGAPRGPARAGKEQTKSKYRYRPNDDAVEEQSAVRAMHVVAQHRELVS